MNTWAWVAALMSTGLLRRSLALSRVGVYLGVVGLVVGAYGARLAHAAVAEGALQFGRDMAPLAEYLHDPTPLSLNGERMVLATGWTDESVHAVLDHYESYCRTGVGNQGKEWSTLALPENAKGHLDIAKLGGSFDMGVYRLEREGDGAIMCFMRGEGSQRTIVESLTMFDATHDFGALGKMRYAYVVGDKKGKAMVITAWTDDRFRLDAFMPEDGKDAPGTDPSGLPRPPRSTRLFAAELESARFGAHIYRSAASPDEVRKYYDAEMTRAGWDAFGWGDDAIDSGKHRIYTKDGLQIALATQLDEGGTLVSVGETGAIASEERAPLAEVH